MKTRIISGALAASGLISLVVWGELPIVLGLIWTLSILATIEFQKLFFGRFSLAQLLRMLIYVAVFFVMIFLDGGQLNLILLFGTVVLQGVIHVFLSPMDGEFSNSLRAITLEFFCGVYVALIFGFFPMIWQIGNSGRYLVLLLLLMVSLGDTMAYFVGTRFGKHALAGSISPKKTWEGAAASVLTALLVTCVWIYLVPGVGKTTAICLLAFAPICSIFGQFGDLFESVLKRSQAQKDSGSFLPGHGGVLDRTDAYAFAAPAFYFYLVWISYQT